MNGKVREIVTVLVVVSGFGMLSAGSVSAAVLREDLSACELPHGTLELPSKGSPLALRQGGRIFNFEQARLMPDPWDMANERAPSAQAYLQRIRQERTGDIVYSPLTGGTLVVMSGRIQDLGVHFLYEFDGGKLERPAQVWGIEDRERIPGIIESVEEGLCYLVETVTGKYALIRLIEKKGRSAIIDWVYQPSGTRVFKIPKGELIEPTEEEVAEAKETARRKKSWELLKLELVKVEEINKATAAHLENRKRLIQVLMSMVESEQESIPAKSAAIRVLGEIRAAEAAPLLACRLDIPDFQTPTRAVTWKVVVAAPALIKIGKPGAAACLEEIVKLTPEESPQPFKEKLLCLVIVRVEGEKIARILLEDRKQTATNTQQIENLQRAINLIDEIKFWR